MGQARVNFQRGYSNRCPKQCRQWVADLRVLSRFMRRSGPAVAYSGCRDQFHTDLAAQCLGGAGQGLKREG